VTERARPRKPGAAKASLAPRSPDLADVAAQASRLLEAVERGDLVADDAPGRRVVEAWRVLAAGVIESASEDG